MEKEHEIVNAITNAESVVVAYAALKQIERVEEYLNGSELEIKIAKCIMQFARDNDDDMNNMMFEVFLYSDGHKDIHIADESDYHRYDFDNIKNIYDYYSPEFYDNGKGLDGDYDIKSQIVANAEITWSGDNPFVSWAPTVYMRGDDMVLEIKNDKRTFDGYYNINDLIWLSKSDFEQLMERGSTPHELREAATELCDFQRNMSKEEVLRQ